MILYEGSYDTIKGTDWFCETRRRKRAISWVQELSVASSGAAISPPAPPSFLAAHGIEDSCSWQSNQSQRETQTLLVVHLHGSCFITSLFPALIKIIQNSRRHQVSPNVPGVSMHKPQIAEAVGKYLKAGGSSAGVFSADHRLIQGSQVLSFYWNNGEACWLCSFSCLAHTWLSARNLIPLNHWLCWGHHHLQVSSTLKWPSSTFTRPCICLRPWFFAAETSTSIIKYPGKPTWAAGKVIHFIPTSQVFKEYLWHVFFKFSISAQAFLEHGLLCGNHPLWIGRCICNPEILSCLIYQGRGTNRKAHCRFWRSVELRGMFLGCDVMFLHVPTKPEIGRSYTNTHICRNQWRHCKLCL